MPPIFPFWARALWWITDRAGSITVISSVLTAGEPNLVLGMDSVSISTTRIVVNIAVLASHKLTTSVLPSNNNKTNNDGNENDDT